MNRPASVWHAAGESEVARRTGVNPAVGLDDAEAARRLKIHGPNRLTTRPARSGLFQLLSQFSQPLVLVLIASGITTALLRQWVDAAVILGVVLLNATIGFMQEGKAKSALASLARSVRTEAAVLRAGSQRSMDAEAVVPGDVVALSPGDRVPADMRLLGVRQLRVAEDVLTGESLAVEKHSASLPTDTVLADRRNMAYAGTLVVAGHATGVVVSTGDATEIGRIVTLVRDVPDLATPLTRKMDAFSRQLLWAILALAAATFAVGMWRGERAFEMFMAAVALAVGAIPEGLPAAMTVTLAIGVTRMARRRAIIRQLPAVETLGSTTVICSDKTGTLTENAMMVRELRAGGTAFAVSGNGYNPDGGIEADGIAAMTTGALREILLCGALCNDARLVHDNGQWRILGDPTEGALLVVARKGGLDEATIAATFPRLDELPFDSAYQYMATLHEVGGIRVVYAKGAVEKLVPACTMALARDGRETALDPAAVHAAATAMAHQGLRVLAFARGVLRPGLAFARDAVMQNLQFVGLAGMIDPPRPQAIAAVRACHSAGIRVKMITGDHPGTALAVAHRLGIAGRGATVLTGRELGKMDDASLARAAADINIFARIEPEQKLRLVRALQADGEVVAMTGDGVNDAPALRQADIGVAMGQAGTEVAKESAAMVLTDDNFATIEAAIEEGRGIYDNLVKFIVWTIPTNAGEGLVVLVGIFAGTTLPIAPLQILWINMTTAVLLGMMLAFEPVEAGIMQRRPRATDAPILDRALLTRTAVVVVFMLAGTFGLFALARHLGQPVKEARTAAAGLFVTIETLYLFSCRSLSRPPWTAGKNPWVWIGSGTMLALQSVFTYAPAFNRVFGTAPLGLRDGILIVVIAVVCAGLIETEKLWRALGRGQSR